MQKLDGPNSQFNMTTAVKDNDSANPWATKGEQRRISILFYRQAETMTQDEEKAEVLHIPPLPQFLMERSIGLHVPSPWPGRPSTMKPHNPSKNGQWPDTHKYMALDGIHLKELRELKEVLTEPLSNIHQHTQLTGEVPAHKRFPNAIPI